MKRITGLAAAILVLSTAIQITSVKAQLLEKKVLTLGAALRMASAAQAEAERRQLAGVIAIADDGGWPILVLRMDNAAYVASVELAPESMLTELRSDNLQLLGFMRAAHQLCDECRDVATASVLENWIDETERRVWFLYETTRG